MMTDVKANGEIDEDDFDDVVHISYIMIFRRQTD